MSNLNHQQREKLSYQYTVALEQGDMDTLARILFYAETDPMLEDMIIGVNQVIISESLSDETSVNPKENNTMPVFTPTKRKRSMSRTRWTVSAAIVASLLFSAFAIFFASESTPPNYNAEAIVIENTPFDKEAITRQFLDALNDNVPAFLPDYLTDDFVYDELGIEPMNQIEMTKHIFSLNDRFTEFHFFMSDISQSDTRLYASLTLKGLHRNAAGQELNYMTTGFINVTFEGDQISRAEFTINIDDFMERYAPRRDEVPQASDLYQLPPDDFDTGIQSQEISVDDESVRGMSLNINAGHSELLIGSLPDTILQGTIHNVGAYQYSEKGERIKIISIENHPYYLLDDNGEAPQWAFKIGENVRTDLNVTTGNRDAMLDLSLVDLQGLTLRLGGGLTSLNLPVTGDNYHVTVTMLSSLGRLRLNYPKKIGLRIDAYDGVWQSQNYNHSEQVINLQLDGSLSVLEMADFE